jgi:hypothetical protein
MLGIAPSPPYRHKVGSSRLALHQKFILAAPRGQSKTVIAAVAVSRLDLFFGMVRLSGGLPTREIPPK